MKKIISMVCALALVSGVAFAQNPKGDNKKDGNWREKVRAEQVGFITAELNLTEAEAQAFWPVYNDVQAQRREAFKAQHDALKAMQNGAEGKEAEKLLDDYLAAKKKCESIEADAVLRYKKVLPVQKVAKLLMAEEKFRHQQIGKLGKGQGGPRMAPDGNQGNQGNHGNQEGKPARNGKKFFQNNEGGDAAEQPAQL